MSLSSDRVTAIQETYVRKVVDTLNEFDNVIFEIGNECHGDSTAWQYRLLRLIHDMRNGCRNSISLG